MSQVVIAEYKYSSYFKVPEGIDINDKTVIEYYCIKWNILYIKFIDRDDEIEIEATNTSENDMKHSDNITVDLIENHDWLIEDEEEDII